MREAIEKTIQRFGLGYPFEIEADRDDIITVKTPASVGRRLLMELVYTCDQLKLMCYIDARADQLYFVAFKP